MDRINIGNPMAARSSWLDAASAGGVGGAAALERTAALERAAAVAKAESAEPMAPRDVVILADVANVSFDEAITGAGYSGELGEVLDELVTDESEEEDAEVRNHHLVSLEQQAEGWIIAGWPIDVDPHTDHPVQPAIREDEERSPEDVPFEPYSHEVPSFVEWFSDWNH